MYWTGLDEWDSPRSTSCSPGSTHPSGNPRCGSHTPCLLRPVCFENIFFRKISLPQRNFYQSTSAYFLGIRSHPEMWRVQILVPCGVSTSQAAVSFPFRLRPDKRIKKIRVHKPGQWWTQYTHFADNNGTVHILYSPLIPHS